LEAILLRVITRWGYFGVFSLIALENIFPPIPSEIILSFSGFFTTVTDLNLFLVIAAASAGSLLGALVLYLVGTLMTKEKLTKFCDSRLGKLLHIKKEQIEKADAKLKKHGKKSVFICRFIPIVRSLISIPCGMTKMKLSVFVPLTLLGTTIWNTALVILGRGLGLAWHKVGDIVSIYSYVVAAITAVMLIVFFVILLIRKRKQKRQQNDSNLCKTDGEKPNSTGVKRPQRSV
jgi:membrane protein DedA with SNARE-associated domain